MFEAERELQGLTRRFAQIAIPGITEPKAVSGITIPKAPTDGPKSGNPGQPRPSGEEIREQQKRRAKARQREQLLSISEIESVEFSLYSTEEINMLAVVNVTSTEEYGPNSVRDLRMGPHNDTQLCDTCSSDIRGCPGHFGKIQLPRLMHPLAVNTIILVLSCICNTCGGLMVTRDEIRNNGIDRMSGVKRLQEIKNLVKKLGRNCKRYSKDTNVEECKPTPVYSSLRDNKGDYRLAYSWPGTEKKKIFFKTPEEIYRILNAISDEDAELLGFTEGSHPRNMIIDRLIVIPYCARPDLFQGEKFFPDDLTTMYIDIVKDVRQYYSNISEPDKEACLKNLYYKVSHFMKNDGTYSQGQVKVYTDIKKRVQGKTAVVRANIMGKRVNFAGRTVVGPAAYLRVDEIGVPRLMAVKLTRPIPVAEFNRTELQAKYDSGNVKHITMQNGSFAGSRVMVNESFKSKFPDYRLQLGDIVERTLEDGDIVLVNRQPTLHKQNILAVRAKIIDDRIARINLSITTPLNAKQFGVNRGN